jgi:foldase protein PrsA
MNLKKIITFTLGVSLVLSLGACTKSLKFSGVDGSTVVAKVGDQNITASELKFYLTMDKEQAEANAGLSDKSDKEKRAYWNTKDGDTDRKQALIDNTLNNLAELKTLLICASKDNVKLEQQELDDIAKSIENMIDEKGKGDRKKAEKELIKEQGVTIDEYKKMYEEYSLAYFNYKATQPYQMGVSEDEIKKEFDSNKEQYEKVTVKHVLIGTQDPNTQQNLPEDKVAEKKKLAEEVLEKAKAGADFEELVSEYSEDPGAEENKGEYTFGKGEMVPEFEEWSFGERKEGEVDIVQTDFGFHIMKFIKKSNTLEDAKDDIIRILQQKKFQEKVEEAKKQYPLEKDQKVIDKMKLF